MARAYTARMNAAGLGLWVVGALSGEGLALAGAGLCLGAQLWEGRMTWVRRYALGLGLFALYVLDCVVGAKFAAKPLRPGAPWSALNLALFPVACLAWRRASAQHQKSILRLALGVASLSAVLALVQHFVPINYGWLARFRPTYRMAEPSMGGYTSGGLHFHRLKYAHTLVVLVIATIPRWWAAAHRRPWPWALAGCLFATSILGAHTAAAPGAALVGLLCYAAAEYCQPPERRVILWAVVGIALALPGILALVTALPPDRHVAWVTALKLIAAHPLLGVGYGGYPQAALDVMGGVNSNHPLLHMDAHALGLQVLAEQGLLGAVLLGLLVWRYARLVITVPATCVGLAAAVGVIATVHNFLFHGVVTAAVALAFAIASTVVDNVHDT